MASQKTLSGPEDTSLSSHDRNDFLVSEHEHAALATPPPKSPRFVFLSEEKEVPEKLSSLQEISLRRREEFQTNIHELELRVAGLSARLAQESMDRQNALQDVLTNVLYTPLEASINELQLGTESDRLSATSSWVQLEGHVSALDTKMTHSLHVELEDALREKLEDLLAKLEYQIQPDTKLELYKANKREGSLFLRFEELVGSMARRFHEERISLQAAIARTSNQIAAMEDLDQQKGEIFLEKIGKIQALLDEERLIRRAQDARIMQLIEQQESIMKEALMQVIGIDQSEETNFRKLSISGVNERMEDEATPR